MIRASLTYVISSPTRITVPFLMRSMTTTKADVLSRPLFVAKNTATATTLFYQPNRNYSHSTNADEDSCRPASILKHNRLASSLIEGVMMGNSGSIRHALTKGANPNQALTNGTYVLHYAVECGNWDGVTELLMAGANINSQTIEERDTPLHIACMAGNDLVVNKLLQQGAKFTIINKEGYSPLELAIISHNSKCVKLLIHKGAPINQFNPTSGCTPLMLACQKGSYDVARLLVYFGADTNFRGNATTLHLAANEPKILQLLLDHGASINHVVSCYSPDQEQIGDSVLHTAARLGNLESVQLLLKYKCNPHHRNKLHLTPLDVARLQLIAQRINPCNPPQTTARVCAQLDRVISLLDVM